MYSGFEGEIKTILTAEQIKKDEKLAAHTTFRIGGPADYFLMPANVHEVAAVVELCKKEKIPYYVLGNGSNILAGDLGFRGAIIQVGKKMSEFEILSQDGEQVHIKAQAGILLSTLARWIANQSLTGFEFASGIPGTLGGAVAMNAGAYGGEIKDCICCATVLDSNGNITSLDKEELELGYRTSIIQKEDYIVLEAEFCLSKGDSFQIQERMVELQKKRKEKQPLEYPSAGSTFKRPEGYFAGKLIEDSGLKGYRVGDIMVSDKHCGFVVNVGKGTAKDAHQLLQDVERKVWETFQVQLEPEVRFLGE